MKRLTQKEAMTVALFVAIIALIIAGVLLLDSNPPGLAHDRVPPNLILGFLS